MTDNFGWPVRMVDGKRLCVGCESDEFRVDGYCSVECRNKADAVAEAVEDYRKACAELTAENRRLKSAILAYGNNPAGLDWTVLEKLEQAVGSWHLEKLAAAIRARSDSPEYVST